MSLPISQLDLVNLVLNELGKPSVTNVNDTDTAIVANNKLNFFFPLMLLKTTWNDFVKFYISNTPNTFPFSPDYAYTYTLPGDFGRLFKFGNFTFPVIYQITDGLISANVKPIQFYYIVNTAAYGAGLDSGTMQFNFALAVWVAADMCMVTTNNAALTKYLEEKAKKEISNAILLDNMNKEIVTLPYNSFNRQLFI